MIRSWPLYLAATAAISALAVLILVRADGAPPATQPAADQADPQALVGKPAPDFKLLGLDGATHSLAEVKGHVVVLDFWATWCVPCHVELPHLQELYDQQSSQGLKLFAVNSNDDPAKAKPYVSDNHLSLPVLLDSDGTASTAYKVDEMPETVVIGKDGAVRNVFVGYKADTSPAEMAKAVAAAMSE